MLKIVFIFLIFALTIYSEVGTEFSHVKVKLSLWLTTSNYTLCRREGAWGSGYIDPHFLDLGISWRWVARFTPLALTLGERATDTHWIGGWIGPRAGLDDTKQRNFLTLPELGTLTPRSSGPSPIAIPTTLSRLRKIHSCSRRNR
jgi:hypothetical protein